MTHDDLATLIRADVAATEPHHGLDPTVSVRLGRGRLRARRLRVAGTVAGAAGTAAALAAVAGVMGPLSRDGSDPASTGSTPESWAQRAQAALEPVAGPLPTTSVRQDGPTRVVGLGTSASAWHFYTVRSDPGGRLEDPAAYCQERLALGYVSCVVQVGQDGEPVVVQELAVTMVGANQTPGLGHTWDLGFARMPIDRIDSVDPGDRHFRREAVVSTASGTLTLAEQLPARTAAEAAAAYDVPPADLAAVVSDPDLAEAH